MDRISAVQYRKMAVDMAEKGIEIEHVLDPAGDIAYIHRAGVVLVLDDDDNHLDRVTSHLAARRGGRRVGVDRVPEEERYAADGLVELRVSGMSVRDAVATMAAGEAERAASAAQSAPPPARVGLDHIIHICRTCPATEPRPMAPGTQPRPPVKADHSLGHGVHVAVCDTGLTPFDPVAHPWMAGVVAGPAPTDTVVLATGPNGVPRVDKYAGHGTFVAGVVRTMAPGADVVVGNHMATMESATETDFTNKLGAMLAALDPTPDILVLSAGTLAATEPLAWINFKKTVFDQHQGMVLIAAAGNNGDNKLFWPAAADWTTGVGALKPDQVTRAAFSDFGDNADVFVRGENMVNVFPTGVYTYDEKNPGSQKTFTGMASWDGTSFSAPLFAGMVAARMSRNAGEKATDAVAALLTVAKGQEVAGEIGPGPVLRWQQDL